MKCIKAVKETKYSKLEEIRRVKDTEASDKVAGGNWIYISKSEWKMKTRNPINEIDSSKDSSVPDGQTIAEKQLKRKKNRA